MSVLLIRSRLSSTGWALSYGFVEESFGGFDDGFGGVDSDEGSMENGFGEAPDLQDGKQR
jgi:hypothetical protein